MLHRLFVVNGSRLTRALRLIPQRQSSSRVLRLRSKRLEAAPTLLQTPLYVSAVRRFAEFTGFPNKAVFEEVCEETLESLTDVFEELVENADHLKGADVSFSDGVLTVQFGEPYGTYVINRQSPNEQIWLSSPTSGPKRYDYIGGGWVYRHDSVSLHELLNKEISKIVNTEANFQKCSHSQPTEK